MQSINVPIGGIDRKVDPHLMAQEDYLDAMNIRNHQGGVVPIKGNVQVSLTLPSGTNKFIGSVEDQLNRRTIFFVWNSSNNHCIVEYKNGVARILGQPSPAYEFASGRYIHSAKIIDGDLLFWTDALVLPSGVITGSSPKKISTKRLDIVKNLTHTVNFFPAAFIPGAVIIYQVVSLITGATIVGPANAYTVQVGDTPTNVVAGVRNGIVALGSQVTYIGGELFMEVQHPGVGLQVILDGGAIAYPTNYYRTLLSAEEITVGRPFPKTPPYPYYEKATGVLGNRVQKPFQFRYRYQFSDGEYSAWSPVSYVPTNFTYITARGGGIINDVSYNRINIGVNDPRLKDPNWRSLIKGIDIAYKNYDTGVWRFVQRDFKIRQTLLAQTDIKFLGIGESAAVPSDEASAPNAQALKNFDFVPRLALAHEFTYDKQGAVYGFWAGILQGYNLSRVRASIAVSQKEVANFSSPTTQASLLKTIKSGGRYKLGVIYENALHQGPVIPIGEVSIPFNQMFGTFDNKGYSLSVTINSNPPSWATHYRIVITKNLNQSQYVQVPVSQTLPWIINTQDNTAVLAGSQTPTHIGFTAPRKIFNEANDRNILFDFKEQDARLFIPAKGDRVQVVAFFDNPNLAEQNIPLFNHEVAGYCLTYPSVSDEDRFTIFVKHYDNIPLYVSNNPYIIEIYKQQEIESPFYYEIGDVYAITNGAHATNPVDLSLFGDAYMKGIVHVPELHPWEDKYQPDYGREQIEDPNYKETFEFDLIRATDTFISETEINGLSSFRGSNFIRLNKENGEIFKLVKVDSILLAVCRNRSQPIYVNKSELLDLTGQTLVGRSNALLNIAEELNQELGTQNPTSIVSEDSTVYGWDAIRGTVWRYSVGAGQFPISYYKMAEYFNTRTRLLQSFGLLEDVIGGYHREFGMYYINFKGASIPQTVTVPYETWGFEEQRNGNPGNKWPSRFTMNPDIFATCLSEFFSATSALFKHEVGYTQYNNAYPVYIQIVVNANSEIVKNFYRVTVEANSLWNIPTIIIPGTADYPAGMRSRLTPNKLSKYEGQWMGDFLRDETDPRYAALPEPERTVRALLQGRPLRGEVMYITLQLSSVSDSVLRKIITTFEPSKIV